MEHGDVFWVFAHAFELLLLFHEFLNRERDVSLDVAAAVIDQDAGEDGGGRGDEADGEAFPVGIADCAGDDAAEEAAAEEDEHGQQGEGLGAHSVGGDGGDGGAGGNESGRSAGVGCGYPCQQEHDVGEAHGDEDQHSVEGDEIGGEAHHFAGVGAEEPFKNSAGNRDGDQRSQPSERDHPASGVGAVAVLVF